MEVLNVKPGSDTFDEALNGYVRAERISDVLAKPTTKRYRSYLRLIQDQFMGEPATDPGDEYRDRELLPRAIDAYERKHPGVELVVGRIFRMEDFPVACAPDAIDPPIGITFHIRRTFETYQDSVTRGVTAEMFRRSQACMAVTGLPYWLHCDYFEDAERGIRKLYEHTITHDRIRGEQLLEALQAFAARTRFKAAEASAA